MTTITPSRTDDPAPTGTGRRLLAAPSPDLRTHRLTHGDQPALRAGQIVEQVALAGLSGRGGAAFPSAVKLRAVASAPGRAVVVGNAAEGEPASDKDRQLLQLAPHLVLDGLQLAALAVGATQAFLCVRGDAVPAVQRALAERGRSDRTPVTVVQAAPGFVSGQETAVVSRLNGGPPLPQSLRQRVTVRGVGGRPTLVQNVETLAHLALIARHGGAWFAANETWLATVHPVAPVHPVHPAAGVKAVWEVPRGVTLRRLLETSAGVPVQELQAVLVGGYHGAWLPLSYALDAPLTREGLSPLGGSLGAGVIVPITSSSCGLEATAKIVRYLAAESAKQCGPCMFGLPHLARLMSGLAAGAASSADLAAIRQAAGLVAGRGACHHPDGTARLVRSALATFDKDVAVHGHGRCLARIADHDGGRL